MIKIVKLLIVFLMIMNLLNCGLLFDLNYYAKKGDIVKVKELINNGINVDVRDSYGRTPLQLTESAEVARFLIEKGADVNAKIPNCGYTSLHTISNPEVARILIEHGADVNAKDEWGKTPLHHVKNLDVARILIKNGAQINAHDFVNNSTPLHFVPNDSIKILIENGADVNAKDIDGDTPLHWATSRNDVNRVLLFIKNGSNVNIKNKEGKSPLKIAKEKGYEELVKILEEHGAKE